MNTIYLKHAATLGERTITELTLQEPTVMHIMRTDGHELNTIGADVALLSALSGESEEILKRIHIEDWAGIRYELQKVYAVFFGVKESVEKKNGSTEQTGTMTVEEINEFLSSMVTVGRFYGTLMTKRRRRPIEILLIAKLGNDNS